jgi:HEAT repeat protein
MIRATTNNLAVEKVRFTHFFICVGVLVLLWYAASDSILCIEVVAMIRFPCPSCDAGLKTADEKAGTHILCPACGDRVAVPAAGRAGAAGKKHALRDSRHDDDQGAPAKPSSKAGLYIGLGAAACVLFAGVGIVVGMYVLKDGDKPSETKVTEGPKAPSSLLPTSPPSQDTSATLPPPPKTEPKEPKEPKSDKSDTKPSEPATPAATPPAPSVETGTESSFNTEVLHRKLIKSAVWIATQIPPGAISIGSGALVDKENRLILTNHHVISHTLENSRLAPSVFFAEFEQGKLIDSSKHYMDELKQNKGYLTGRVVFHDQKRDLALVQLVDVPVGAVQLELAASSPAQGQPIFSIGNPAGSLWMPCRGMVRKVEDDEWVAGGAGGVHKYKAKTVLTDSTTNPGDSGGPVVNGQNELVAVVHGVHQQLRGWSKFIDITEVRAFLNEYRKSNNLPPLPDKPASSGQIAGTINDVPGLVNFLKDPASTKRAWAASRLGQIGPDARAAVGPLVASLKDSDPAVRKNAAEALESIGSLAQSQLPALIALLNDPDKDVQIAAIRAIKTMGAEAEEAVPALCKALKHPEESVRKKVVNTLANLGPAARAAVPDLAQALKDKSPGVRVEAAVALGKMGTDAAPARKELGEAIRDSQPEVTLNALSAIAALGPEAVPLLPDLEKALTVKSKEVRLRALAALAAIGRDAKGAIPSIIEAMEVEDYHAAARETLMKIGTDSIAPLIKALSNRDKGIRLGAVTCLGEFKGDAKAAVPALQKLLQSEKELKIRVQANAAIGKIKRG